ncbi:MAG TPA: L-aspartate oxidase [bacterium (Candidatus Stahlbacteria)]|nr:L-aspartate oxidase [Candidatus Stahlbacteria bacterium]
MEILETDHLVIGSGIAGLVFAINIPSDHETLVLTKKKPSDSNTNYAQGGIAAALGPDDSPSSHAQDTIRAGAGLSKPEIVKFMTEEAPRIIEELSSLGVPFTRVVTDGKADYAFGNEGGHSHPRIVFVKDHTGYEVEATLLKNVKGKIKIIEGALALDLIVRDGECYGCYFLDTRSGEVKAAVAKSTLIATGGAGQIYRLTTNPRIATGDGVGMAFRAGLLIANMEFIQFHPTGVYDMIIDGRVFLISEAVRGEGGILKRLDGNPFMLKYDPRGCLAPRDIVARAIHTEMLAANKPYVYLDISYLDSEWIKRRFPTIYDTCLKFNLDITKAPIPVAPAAHYLCGGILVDRSGKTNIKRLYASGEVAMTGVHGANRLASNSLLEAMVFTKEAALKATNEKNIKYTPETLRLQDDFPDDRVVVYSNKLKELMTEKAGIVRSIDSLNDAHKKLIPMLREVLEVKNQSPRFWELKNMLCTAILIVEAALRRKESRGLHYLIDFPEQNDNYCKDTVIATSELYHEIISHR